jgi:hypothetical protein
MKKYYGVWTADIKEDRIELTRKHYGDSLDYLSDRAAEDLKSWALSSLRADYPGREIEVIP